ncbi:MAG TPA: hypothetical protein VHO06_13810, partial [Polyangia bacterium]|nr:hypothetical protein [Polyangia bacterium]
APVQPLAGPNAPAVPPPAPEAPLAVPPPPASTGAAGPQIGFLVGLLAFPRPIEGELVVKLGTAFALGLQGSFLPELTVPGVDAKLDLKAVQGIVRWFPGDGVFFLGAGLGYQSLQASIGDSIDNGELTITADMSGFFVAPQLGVLWISSSGVALSLGLGLQIPIPKDPVVSATYNGQPVPSQPTATVPQDVIDKGQSDKNSVQSAARFIVKYPFPEIDLLRIGIFF